MCMALVGMHAPNPSISPSKIHSLQDGDTPLISAAGKGHTDIASMLLDYGADKDAKNNVGDRPVMHCHKRGPVRSLVWPCVCSFPQASHSSQI